MANVTEIEIQLFISITKKINWF